DRLGAIGENFTFHATAHRFDDRRKSLLHVRRLAYLVLRPFPMEAQDGNAPAVFDLRIDLAIGMLVRDHLAPAVKADEGAVVAARVLLELAAVAAPGQPFEALERVKARHAPAAAEFDVVSARKTQLARALLFIEPPGRVHMAAACALFVVWRQAFK